MAKKGWRPWSAAIVVLLVVTRIDAICQKREVLGDLSIPGHHPLVVRYNVCVDNTTISPEPSMVQTGVATFIRECCGCRVSSVTEREHRLQTLHPPSETRSIYVPEIQACECVACDTNVYDWAQYFMFLNHRRRK
ncbi:uncharacterized protein LOC101846594 [Aplysia californica]|uniref:Uncharacterized protein LOC101846594 n=1 Tax=Aplysia californica TaxID=6500 RepID=A0ABM0JVZ9_APLCA|nr:uncharacterized protein LOC101846594 [Aplysia californica]